MYILETKLLNRIHQISGMAANKSYNAVKFEEHIALPYFGQIILRFSLDQDRITLSDLDDYEKMLYEIVGDEFLVDFMGSVYNKVGIDYTNLENQLRKLFIQLASEQLQLSVHSKGLKDDADFLLRIAGLETNEKVWEIQPDENEMLLLIMGKQNRRLKEINTFVKLYVGEVSEESCTGLIQAAFYAKRNGISLARVLSTQ